jgi:beta-lactamase class A
MFRSLYVSSFLNKENSQKLLQWLFESSMKDFLASGLPSDIPFAHKFGENMAAHVFSDSGIVYLPNRPYLLTVMIQGDGSATEREQATALMKSISEKTYQYINSY